MQQLPSLLRLYLLQPLSSCEQAWLACALQPLPACLLLLPLSVPCPCSEPVHTSVRAQNRSGFVPRLQQRWKLCFPPLMTLTFGGAGILLPVPHSRRTFSMIQAGIMDYPPLESLKMVAI